MNYIYDILLNFNNNFYDFFEWNINDDIIHVRKMPIFRVDSNTLKDLTYSNLKINVNFLESIKYKTEIFNNRDINSINYACLLSDGNRVCAIYFNEDGTIKLRSDLLIDEAIEVFDVIESIVETKLDYKIINIKQKDDYKTRNEVEIEQYLIKQINKLKKENETEKLRYLYYECFSIKEFDINKIMERLNNEIKNNWDNVYSKVYNFLKISSTNK
jgi:hypothetical protein